MGNIGGFIVMGIIVLAVIYIYNSFIAEKGKTISDLGRKTA